MWLKCSVLLLFALFANNGEAANCNMPDEGEWNTALRFPVKENEPGVTKTYKIENIQEVKYDSIYVTHQLDVNSGSLTFSLTPEFDNFVQNEDSSQKLTSVTFTCGDGGTETKDFFLIVTQIDFLLPEIIGKPFKFDLKMPILPNTLIPEAEIKVSEKNLDMGTGDINFLVLGSCGENFEFGNKQSDGKKVFKATLKSKDKIVKLDKPVTCDIQVNTKHGEDGAQMTLNVDIKESVPPNPQFEQPLYAAILKNDNNIDPIEIKLINKIFNPNVTWESDVYKEYFELNINKEIMTFSSVQPLPSDAFDNKNFITVKIEAKYAKAEGPGRTVVIISPKDTGIREVPEFVKPLYVAQYVNPNKITVEDIELISADRDAKFDIHSEDGYKDYFHFDKKKLTIQNLPENVFQDKNSISITIEATYTNVPVSDKTVVIVNGPEKIEVPKPVFKKPLYETKYEDANTINIEDIELEPTEITYPVEFDVIADKKEYFKFDNKKLTIHDLPESEFDGKNYISVKILATYTYKDVKSSGETVVVINPPEKIVPPTLVFQKQLYQAQYKDENSLDVEKISLQSVDKDKNLKFDVISEHKQYFTFENDVLTINGLPKDVFDEKNYILINIEAKYEGTEISGKTTVLINGPKDTEIEELVFAKPLYEAQYENENKLTVDDIKLQSYDPNKEVEYNIVSEHKTYFKFEDDKLTINGLPKTVFDDKNYILITIEANYKGEKTSGKTNVLINGPKEIDESSIPVFAKSLYEAQYENENKLTVEDIKLVSSDPNKKVKFEVISEHKQYLNFDENKLTIQNLPATVFDNNYILVTIEAKYEGENTPGKTIVLINGPTKTEIPTAVFQKSSYEAQYVNENEIKVEDIKLKATGTTYDVKFEIISDLDKNYFKFENEKLSIKNLPVTVFDKNNFISITIQAKYVGALESGETVVIINGPEKTEIPTAVFEKSSYEGQYINENEIKVEDIKLKPTGTTYDVKFEIISDLDKNYFKFENEKLSIKDLPVTVFDKNNFISITIQAKYVGGLESGETVVIIKGPEKTEIPTAVFEKSSYEAQYINENEIKVEDIKLKPTGTTFDVKFEIISDLDKNYFKFENEKLSIKDLPVTVFDKNNFISITIQAKYVGGLESGETVVIINGPEKTEISTAVFEKSSYEAQYINENEIKVEDIKLKPTGTTYDVKFEIISDLDKNYFKFENEKLSIKDLPVTVFDKNNFISITIQAKYVGALESGETVVIINGPDKTEVPTAVFEQSSYEAKYIDSTTIEHDEILLKPTAKPYKVDYKIISAYEKHFSFDPDTHKLTVIDPLSEDIFDDKNFISVTIEATYTDASSSGYTVVIINAPDELVPAFEKPLYEAQYKDKDTIQVEEIKLKPDSSGKKVSYKIDTDLTEKYFSFNNNELKIHDLPVTVFDGKHFISIKIKATYEGATLSAETVVIINGPDDNEIPTAVFENSLYEAQYINENKIDVEDIKLIPTGIAYKVEFEIISDLNKAYFNFENEKLSIKDLPVTVFDKNNFISLTIQAKYVGALKSGETVVIIHGPEKTEIPTAVFEHSSYEAKYIDSTTIEHDEILLKPTAKPYKVDYKIISAYEKHFSFDPDTHKLTVIDPLSEDIFDDKNFISVTIEATYTDASSSGYTVVIINAPDELVPAFEKPLYEAQYKDKDTIQVEEIKLKPDSSGKKVSYKIDTDLNEKYFSFNNNELKIHDLPVTVFDGKHFISIKIQATYEGTTISAETVVIINGPDNNEIPTAVFENSLYEAQYINENKIDVEDIKLIPTGITYKVEFEIISDLNKAYFNFENERLSIKDLPVTVFDKNNFISLTIQAKYVGALKSGETVVIINGPEKTEIPTAVFEKSSYEAQYINENEIKVEDIKLKPTGTAYKVEFEIISDLDKNYFKFENAKLSIKNLPVTVFDKNNFISLTIQAKYAGALKSGETVVIINGPEKTEIPTAVFEKSSYEAQYINENEIKVEDIKLKPTGTAYKVEFEIISDLDKNYFKFENAKLSIKNLPVTVFDKNNFISLTIQAKYVGALKSGETVVIINGPEKTEIPTAVFEQSSYEAKYIDSTTIEHDEILLKPTAKPYKVDYKIISAYEKHFSFDSDTHILTVIDPLSEDIFDDKNFISVTIGAKYKDASSSGYTVVIINSPNSDTKHTIYFDKQADVMIKDSPITGILGTYEAVSDDSSEEISYSIDKSSVSNLFEYNDDGVLSVTGNLPAQPYYQITLIAKGDASKVEAKMDVIIIDKKETNIAGFKFENRLEVHNVPENSDPTVIVPMLQNHNYKIVDDNSEGWFTIEKGNLVLQTVDREDPRFKGMLVAQVKTKIQAEENTKLSTTSNKLQYGLTQFRKQDYCIDISKIPNSYKELYVVVTIEDENDNSPVFKEASPLIIGYPSSEIAEYVAPPYLIKVEATDEDIGLNAQIRYSVDKNFKIDPEKGIIYPSDNLSSDTEFTVTATDKDGADDGRSTSLKIKVKILKEEHITVITANDIAYNETEKFVNDLSKETKTNVKYLSSTALPKKEETKSLRLTKADNKIPVLKIVMYAFDTNQQIIPSPEFRKKIEESSISESVKVSEYESPETIAGQDTDESSDSGWIAAVSTLSVLLALVIIGVIAGYIFYLRPKLFGGPIKYEKHTDNDSTHMAPVELKMESTRTIDRRATGFPIGFNPSDLDEDEDEDELESVKEDSPAEEIDEGINDSEVSSNNDTERRKSVVKFDINVTEIEISEL